MIPCNLLVIISVTTNGEVMIIQLDIIHVPPVSRKISQQSRPKVFIPLRKAVHLRHGKWLKEHESGGVSSIYVNYYTYITYVYYIYT